MLDRHTPLADRRSRCCARTTAAATPCRPRGSIPSSGTGTPASPRSASRHFDMDRAWTEIETLFAHQWDDGMVPHMVFHEPAPAIFPAPMSGAPAARRRPRASPSRRSPASAVAELCRRERRRCDDRARALLRKARPLARLVLPDPRSRGAKGWSPIIHPWESRDNSVDWDEAFERVPTEGVDALRAQRPQARRSRDAPDQGAVRPLPLAGAALPRARLGLDARPTMRRRSRSSIPASTPSSSARASRSPSWRTRSASTRSPQRNRGLRRARRSTALDRLWSDDARPVPAARPRSRGKLLDSPSIGGLIPVFAPIPQGARSGASRRRSAPSARQVRYLVPSHDPRDPRFDLKRYWRGPVWHVCNYLIADGLRARRRDERRRAHRRRQPRADRAERLCRILRSRATARRSAAAASAGPRRWCSSSCVGSLEASMTTFLERWRGRARSLATFGDSITQALHIEPPEHRWANRLAAALGATPRQSRAQRHGDAGLAGGRRHAARRTTAARATSATCSATTAPTSSPSSTAPTTRATPRRPRPSTTRVSSATIATVLGGPLPPATRPMRSSSAARRICPMPALRSAPRTASPGRSRAEFQRYVGTVEADRRAKPAPTMRPSTSAWPPRAATRSSSPDHVHPNARGPRARSPRSSPRATQLETTDDRDTDTRSTTTPSRC